MPLLRRQSQNRRLYEAHTPRTQKRTAGDDDSLDDVNNTAKYASMEKIFAGLPTMKCVDGCSDCCGPILATRMEWSRIYNRLGTTQEKLAKKVEEKLSKGDLNCVLLDEQGRCSVYDIRPAICRLFGVSHAPRLVCPHIGQHPSGLSDADTNNVLNQIERLGV